MWETWVQSLGWEDPLEKGKATHSSILAWRIPWTVQAKGSQRVGHDWATFTFIYTHYIQFCSVAQLCPTLCHSMDCSMPGLHVHHQLLELTQTRVHHISDAIQPSHPLSSPSPPAFNLSQHQGLFQWVSSSNQMAKVLEFQASAPFLPMNTQDWSPLGWTGWSSLQSKRLKSLLQHHSSKVSLLQPPAFFIIQLSQLYTTTGKTIALTRQTFAGKVMSPLFNTLSWLVIAFPPKSKHILISWLQSPSAVILRPKK